MSEHGDVCRLCLTTGSLVYVFDSRLSKSGSMREMITVTTGVEIHENDIVSKRACSKCLEIVLKMYKFRSKAQKNDKELRIKAGQLSSPKKDEKEQKPRKGKDAKSKKETEENKVKEIEDAKNNKVAKVEDTAKKTEVKNIKVKKIENVKVTNIEDTAKKTEVKNSKVKKIENAKVTNIEDTAKKTEVKNTKVKVTKIEDTTKKTEVKNIEDIRLKEVQIRKVEAEGAEVAKAKAKPRPLSKQKVNVKSNSVVAKRPNIHPTVLAMFNINPLLKLPATCLNIDMSPSVFVDKVTTDALIKSMGIEIPKFESMIRILNDQVIVSPSVVVEGVKRPADDSSVEPEVKRPRLTIIIPNPNKVSVSESLVTENQDKNQESDNKVSEGPISVIDKQVAILECDICHHIYYNAKSMAIHRKKHMRCQFCKDVFKSMEAKNHHIEYSCIVRNLMNNPPHVYMTDILKDQNVCRKYRDALKCYLPKELKEIDSRASDTTVKLFKTKDDIESINLDSEDELLSNLAPKKTVVTTKPVEVNNPSSVFKSGAYLLLKTTVKSPMTSVDTNSVSTILNTLGGAVTNASSSATSNSSTVNKSTKTATPPPDTNPEILKPNIKIKNDFMGTIDPKASDVKIMRDLLLKQAVVQLKSVKSVQTSTPTNEDITYNKKENMYLFKNLKTHLGVYKIPVEIVNGGFGVLFSYTPKEQKPKRMNVWSDIPLDIEPVTQRSATPIQPKLGIQVIKNAIPLGPPPMKPLTKTNPTTRPLNPEHPTPLWSAAQGATSPGQKVIFLPKRVLQKIGPENVNPRTTTAPSTSSGTSEERSSTMPIRVRNFSELI